MAGPGVSERDTAEVEANYRDYLRSHSNCFVPLSTNGHDLVQVKIIDLAHTVVTSADPTTSLGHGGVVPSIPPRLDVGYIHGLETLIEMTEELVSIVDNTGSEKSNIAENIACVFAAESLEGIRPV